MELKLYIGGGEVGCLYWEIVEDFDVFVGMVKVYVFWFR